VEARPEPRLREDTREDAPTCRWRHRDRIIDVMPTDETLLGFSNRWYRPAIAAAQTVSIAGPQARVITFIYYLATKLEAFRGRGNDDYSGNHDLEDLAAVIDGRMQIVRLPAARRSESATVANPAGSTQRAIYTRSELERTGSPSTSATPARLPWYTPPRPLPRLAWPLTTTFRSGFTSNFSRPA
jgi:hypothetical protein